MKATVILRTRQIKAESKTRISQAQIALDTQVVKDSNFYCPIVDGTLQRSALRSDFGSGKVEWDTVYARRQYFSLPNKTKDVNPNARMKWFEEAKATKKKAWEAIANREYHK